MCIRYAEKFFGVTLDSTGPAPQYGKTVMGYGSKIPTHHRVRLNSEGPWRRVYATCYSNVASHWIMVLGIKYHL